MQELFGIAQSYLLLQLHQKWVTSESWDSVASKIYCRKNHIWDKQQDDTLILNVCNIFLLLHYLNLDHIVSMCGKIDSVTKLLQSRFGKKILLCCGQYHQHFMHGIFVQMFWEQLFCTFTLGLYFFWRKNICAKATLIMLVKWTPGVNFTIILWAHLSQYFCAKKVQT